MNASSVEPISITSILYISLICQMGYLWRTLGLEILSLAVFSVRFSSHQNPYESVEVHSEAYNSRYMRVNHEDLRNLSAQLAMSLSEASTRRLRAGDSSSGVYVYSSIHKITDRHFQ